MKNKCYIYRKDLRDEIINYFELHNFIRIRSSHLLSLIYEFIKYKIRSLARKILRLHSFNNGICEEEIQNYIYSILLEIIEYWKNFLHMPFEAYFWYTIKLKMINYINKINNRQFDFEEKIANNINNLKGIIHSYDLNNSNHDESGIYNLDFLKSISSDSEYKFLISQLNRETSVTDLYTTYQKNKFIRSINFKIQQFQKNNY
ncbi:MULTISPECIES: hypothetical protein [unclassified Mycoplasma]|uniref:hypothetical protein n=1 Tax=unclassified Mycoplasma TaxID=2683645 RepID=UPI00211D0CCD|nr:MULTISPECIES: hypothetical protein [unclassified Mycoplasma]UUM19568.1 hypothetical protein NPA11_02210 [Mycoplasma sp. 1578d]UUM24487.1 hypothetical protein NPA12_02185 [Mycoplasma sp. 3686d]